MDYDDFLGTDEWKDLRKAALARAKFVCEYCGERAEHVHHIRYPKPGEKHMLNMVVAVCSRCHDISHGAKEMNALVNVKKIGLAGPYENEVIVFHADGLIWASIEQWVKVLDAPYFMQEVLEKSAELQASLLKGGCYAANIGGRSVYRWPPIAAALDLWHRNWMVKVSQQKHVTMPTNLRTASEAFARNVTALKAWGYSLQERELQEAMKQRMSPEQKDSGIADSKQAMQAIETLANATKVVFDDHDVKLTAHSSAIDQIKKALPQNRDPDEFITIKQRCLELSVPHSLVVQGMMTLSQACGQFLKKSGIPQGGNQVERLDGQKLTSPVSTWPRGRIDEALKYYMPSQDDPSQGSFF